MKRVLLFTLLTLTACSAAQAAPAAPPAKKTTAPKTSALEGVEKAIVARDYPTAGKLLEAARAEDASKAMYLETSLRCYEGNYDAAAKALVEHLKTANERAAFQAHNWLSIIRQAQGDLLGALVEADARTRAGAGGTWTDHANQTALKETWHRAYLLRMYAEQVSGNRKEAALGYAEEARLAYAKIAQPIGGYEDSIAVLEAFFAMHDGDHAKAKAAAKRVDIAKNDDVEDLYLVYSALDAAGDKQAAQAVKQRIDSVTYVSFVVPIVRTWIAQDGTTTKHFSPRFPKP